ncbi:exodeoxyribonuclease VII large subunit [Maritimibacter sp. DP1N21-5]|uniref:exodeoxyribonuclease VII large subunit n=1 Tax=Maritimibacter sp. DP1N21-5 TaxID=2836867 RepID=UPI001C4633BE|nr:exodeoxyribonuclease VII large subunit [Maritimibacter sp. DP1N21-5]MBV7410789.1 exodeoxyribonuclease VII large subunit [Maritimibacter sp. DP1N21-5]
MDLIDDDGAPSSRGNAPEFTVSELSGAVKRTIEGEFGHVRVRGEVGRVSLPRSGHVYLDLKDDRAVISGVIWKGVASRLATMPEEGMEVIATGRLTTFPGQSKYQIVIEDIAPAGAGALMAMLEKRKAALAAEGLFSEARKKPIPFLPDVIGVVTSPSGAVIRDILHRLRDRFPRKVLIWPVGVQGQNCAPEVARAIRGFNALTPGGALPRPDLLIVARGGGSIEDLWGFNEELVVRAAAESAIPLISAVGHETDTTLIDFASDRRAPTPTAAAEMAVPVRRDLLAWLAEQEARLTAALSQGITRRGQRLADLSRALPRADVLLEVPRQRLDRAGDRLPAALIARVRAEEVRLGKAAGGLRPGVLTARIDRARDRLDERGRQLGRALARPVDTGKRDLDRLTPRLDPARIEAARQRSEREFNALAARLDRAGRAQVEGWKSRLAALERIRQTLGYTETLKRGYAVVRSEGEVITTAGAATSAGILEIEFADGRVSAVVGGSAGGGAKPKKKDTPPEQGSLF